jgi:hypothetical protein
MIHTRACLMVALLVAVPAFAQQETLGSILDKGAKRMSGADIKAYLFDKTVIGDNENGQWVEASYKADGAMEGTIGAAGFSGDWEIDGEGRVCSMLSIPTVGYNGGGCNTYYRLGERVYRTQSDRAETDRDQLVFERKLKRP